MKPVAYKQNKRRTAYKKERRMWSIENCSICILFIFYVIIVIIGGRRIRRKINVYFWFTQRQVEWYSKIHFIWKSDSKWFTVKRVKCEPGSKVSGNISFKCSRKTVEWLNSKTSFLKATTFLPFLYSSNFLLSQFAYMNY